MTPLRIALAASVACLGMSFGQAQAGSNDARVVSSCAPTGLYTAGSLQPPTQDTTGKTCTNATSSGSTTITGPLGRQADAASVSVGLSTEDVAILNGAIPAGANSIGTVGLNAGSNLIGGAKIIDTGGTNAATVKAASTAAVTTDTSLVVMLSPTPSPVCTSSIAINQTSSTDLVTSVAKLNICSIVLVSASAQNISLTEGTGSVCATGATALIGGTTASVALAVNGGFSAVADRTWLKTKTTADHLCLLQSGGGNVSGIITYADAS